MLDASMLHIGSRRQFFFDNLVIDTIQDVTRRYHSPEKMADVSLIVKDRPWEVFLYFTCNTWNVIRDPHDGLFKCWYENWLLEDARKVPTAFRESDGKLVIDAHSAQPSCVCFAQSEDGVHWEKPELDVVVENGQRTNIVLGKGACGDHAHCAYVFLDPFERDVSRRFKVIFERGIHSVSESTTGTGIFAVAASPDGIHWQVLPDRPVFGTTQDVLGDVVTVASDLASHTYWLNNRHPGMCTAPTDPACPPTQSWISPYGPENFAKQNKRRVFRSESADLIHWSHPNPLVVPDDSVDNIDDAFYGMEQFKVGDDWLGLLNIFHMTDNTMDVQLTYSRNGQQFTRVRPGRPWLAASGPGAWDAYMATVCSRPVCVGDDLYVYYGGANNHHDWWLAGYAEGLDCREAREGTACYGLGLATMKRDRFVSLGTAPVREGVVITRPLRPVGTALVVNVWCEEGGSLVAEISDPAGQVLPGFERENCLPFRGNAVAHTVRWKAGQTIPDGEFLRARFFLRRAEIFSFQFVDPGENENGKTKFPPVT